MAGSTRFELAAGSPEGSAVTGTYPSGQRGSYSNANLDRSGSFREGSENRSLNSGLGSIRGSATLSAEMPPSQFLALDPITMGDQKFARSGELRRLLGVSHGNTMEDHSFGAAHLKPPSVSPEELKRFKGSVLDTSNKARERVKRLNESIAKLDRYRQSLLQRKRRTDSSERSGGASMLRTGSQIHQNPGDLVSQRLEDRTKSVVLNKRARTSIVDSEGRNAVPGRQPLVIDKDRDLLRVGGGGPVQVEEKIRGLPAAGEGWDKKMKRKRSVGTVVTRAMDGEREIKRTMHQKPINDPRSRPTDAHGFGSGPSNGTTGVKQLDGVSQPSTTIVRSAARNELESVSFSNDRRERSAGIDKERVVYKGNKLNVREDGQVGSPSPVTKGKASRAPRTGSGVANSSLRPPGGLDGWEQTSCLNKGQPVGGPTNRKRPISAGSASPPMAQWVGQRREKISRNRRAIPVLPVSNHDEAQISSEGFSAPDSGAKLTSVEVNGSLVPKGASNNGQQYKMKFENVPSPARLSESEESGAGENKLKDRGMTTDEMEDRSVNAIPKVGSFVLPKNNRKEEIGDGVRRQGRTGGRGSSMPRASISQAREKLENPGTTKPVESVRTGSDKIESKSGRPPSKKVSDRKAFNRHVHALNSGSSDMTGESDDDHEELVAAAKFAHEARKLACSGSFWKKIEPVFASISSEDTAYLKRQLNFVEELDKSLSDMFSSDYTLLSELAHNKLPSSQSKERQVHLNGEGSKGLPWTSGSMDQLQGADSLNGKFENGTPLYQRVLSALIEEGEIEELDHNVDRRVSFQHTCDGSLATFTHIDAELKDGVRILSDVDSDVECRNQNNFLLDNFSCDGSTASNSFRNSSNHGLLYDELWSGDDNLVNSEVGVISGFSQNNLDVSLSATTNNAVSFSLECEYEQMSIDGKLLLELQSIGLYLETVPDLTEGEDEINKDISALKEGLYRQVGKKKGQLCKIDEVIQKNKEKEERYLEQSAMNKLVEMAYKKRMACRGNNASKGGVSKTSKQAALAFVKRTIARCRKFEDTGESCFREPALRDIILSPAAYINDAKLADGVVVGANTCLDIHNNQPESRTSAVGATSTFVERHSPLGDKLERGLSDAFQAPTHSSNQAFAKTETLTNRGKKKEVLLDDVTGSAASRASAALANTPLGGAKGRRSERERDQNKFGSGRNSVAKAGRPALGGFRGERKTKTKPKQKTAQLSMSGNGLLGRAIEASNSMYPSVCDPNDKMNDASSKVSREVGRLSPVNARQDSSKEAVDPADFANLQMADIDPMVDLGVSTNLAGQNDLSWLTFDEDGLQDHDSMGLEIPMDDLSELQMLI